MSYICINWWMFVLPPTEFTVIGSLDKQCHVKYLLTIFWWKRLLDVSISPGVVSVVMLNDDIINMS